MSTQKSNRQAVSRRQRGFSLVEILVGVLIGMIGVVVIFQVLSVAEERKRNTTMGSDAQSSGAIGLYLLQRDAQLAGYGFGTAHTKQIGCDVKVHDNGDATAVPPVPARDFSFRLYPAEITQGAGGAPDTIAFVKGNPSYSVQHREFELKTPSDKSSPLRIKNGRQGLEWGNILVMASRPDEEPALSTGQADCVLVQVTHRPTTELDVFEHQTGYQSASEMVPYMQLPGGATTTPRFNMGSFPSATEFPRDRGYLFDLGKQPRRTVWSIQNNKLIMSETLFSFPPEEAADGIINLQAEYGIDQNNDNMIGATEWSTVGPDNTKPIANPALPCDATKPSWRCVRAIRVALLARSAFFDKSACSPNPQWSSGTAGVLTLTDFVMTNVDGSADTFGGCAENPPSPNNWRHYRYRVYETAIPLRNLIWATAPGVEFAGGS
jgi:type IV pilus assembly protein PilW